MGTDPNQPSSDPVDPTKIAFDAITIARTALKFQEGQVSPPDEYRLASQLGQQHRNLDVVDPILHHKATHYDSEIHRAVEIAKTATKWQAATLGLPWKDPVAPMGHDSPSQALLELTKRHGVEPTDTQLEEIRSLDLQPEPLKSSLTRFIDAFLALDEAARLAYGQADLQVLKQLSEHQSRDDSLTTSTTPLFTPHELHQKAGIDLSLVFPTRNQFLDAILDLQETLEQTGIPEASSCSPVAVPLVFSIDLTHCDNHYTTPYALQLDAGGSDVYHNNAGGNSLQSAGCAIIRSPSAALVDLGAENDVFGNPHHPRQCGITGGGHMGTGFLFASGGDNEYHGGWGGTNGGGSIGGAGFLLDVQGNDTYEAADGGTNGGGRLGGLGFLLDAAGSDSYTADRLGVNGGGELGGVGFLADLDGHGIFQAGQSGVNGGSDLGRGFLFSGPGDDVFNASRLATNGGGFRAGAGFLFNMGGDNIYNATRDSTNGGGTFFGGVGMLIDAQGDDRYIATGCGVNGGSGDHTCTAVTETGLGFLIDTGGQDEYIDEVLGHCWDCSMVPKGILGMQIDSDGLLAPEFLSIQTPSVNMITPVSLTGADQ